jgi:hypothetical protein
MKLMSNIAFKEEFGTLAFTVLDTYLTSTFTVLDTYLTSILRLNIVPSHPDDQGTYCSKLAGLFSIVVLIVNHLCSWAVITTGGIKVGCDGVSALNNTLACWPLELMDPHFERVRYLHTMLTASPLTWTT